MRISLWLFTVGEIGATWSLASSFPFSLFSLWENMQLRLLTSNKYTLIKYLKSETGPCYLLMSVFWESSCVSLNIRHLHNTIRTNNILLTGYSVCAYLLTQLLSLITLKENYWASDISDVGYTRTYCTEHYKEIYIP